jgi:hypothetical protein
MVSSIMADVDSEHFADFPLLFDTGGRKMLHSLSSTYPQPGKGEMNQDFSQTHTIVTGPGLMMINSVRQGHGYLLFKINQESYLCFCC